MPQPLIFMFNGLSCVLKSIFRKVRKTDILSLILYVIKMKVLDTKYPLPPVIAGLMGSIHDFYFPEARHSQDPRTGVFLRLDV